MVARVADAILESVVEGTELTDTIRLNFREASFSAPLPPEGRLRASSLYYLCPREEALRSRLGINRGRAFGPDEKLTFDHGHGLHYALQNRIYGPLGTLLGVWGCTVCGHSSGSYTADLDLASLVSRPVQCASCGHREVDGGGSNPTEHDDLFKYHELACTTRDGRLAGHVDGLALFEGREGLGVIEFKSIGDSQAPDARKRPLEAHFLQVQAYMLMTRLRWAKILYWVKSKDRVADMIEHTVLAHQRTQREILLAVQTTFTAIEGGPLPERVCDGPQCRRTESCPVAGPCFAPDAEERYGSLPRATC